MEQPLGQPGLGEDGGEREAAADRGARVRLQDHRVAQRQGRGDGADREDQRGVEGRDHAHDADRDPARVGQAGRLAGQDLARGAGGEGGGLVALLGGHVQFEVGLAGDGPGLADEPLAQFVCVGGEQVTGLAQHPGPHEVREPGPFGLGGTGGHRGALHVLGADEGDGGECVAGGGLGDGVLRSRQGWGCQLLGSSNDMTALRSITGGTHTGSGSPV